MKKYQKKIAKKFREEGLLWLVNTSILHPRGYALTFDIDKNGEVKSIFIQKTDEYWCYMENEALDSFKRYEKAELDREKRFND